MSFDYFQKTSGKYLIEVKFETEYMTQCFMIISISFQQWQKQGRLVRSTFK